MNKQTSGRENNVFIDNIAIGEKTLSNHAARVKVYASGPGALRSWIEEVKKKPGIQLVSDWEHLPLAVPLGLEKIIWTNILYQVNSADVLLLRAAEDAPLRGALVEVGMALAFNTPVVFWADSPHEHFGHWMHHPLIHLADNLDEAIAMCYLLAHPR